MRSEKGMVLTIVLIFIIMLSIMAAIALILMTNQARITESQVKRMQAYYTAQAAIVRTLEALRKGNAPPAAESLNGYTATITTDPAGAGTGPYQTRRIQATVNY